jgi:murein DD-endopeptidase MepM/ murein hydrolase activator NlpD
MVTLSQFTSKFGSPSKKKAKKTLSALTKVSPTANALNLGAKTVGNLTKNPFKTAASRLSNISRTPAKPKQPAKPAQARLVPNVVDGVDVNKPKAGTISFTKSSSSPFPFIKKEQAVVKRPETPAPTLIGSTKEVQKPSFQSYTPEQDKVMVQSILLSQRKGEGLTDEQLNYVTAKQTESLFNQQDSIRQAEEALKASELREAEAIKAEEARIESLSQKLRSERDVKLQEMQARLDAQYAPIRARAEEQAGERQSTQERLLGATGRLTGSVGVQAMDAIEREKTQLLNSIEAEKRAAFELERARLEGADGDTLDALGMQLSSRRQAAETQKQNNIAALEQLKLDASAQGDNQLIEFLSAQQLSTSMGGQEADARLSEGLGYLVDASGAAILSEDGNQIPYGASTSAGAKILDTIQDPATGQFFVTKQFNDGTVYAEPIMLGTPQNTEFAGSPDQNSLVATYSQIFNGSSYNAEGIDLAGKKGSAITSPIAGTVISAQDDGGWGNRVRIQDAQGQIHAFSHLDSIGVQVGQQISPLSFLGTMGNTGNVLKGDGSKPNAEELAAGRGTHLDYTVFDANGNKMPLSVAKAYAGIGETPFAQQPASSFATTPKAAIAAQAAATKAQQSLTADQQKEKEKIQKSDDYKALTKLVQVEDAVNNYKRVFEELGSKPNFVGADSQRLSTAYQGAIMELKNAFELGALAGPDLALLQANLPDPTSFSPALITRGGGEGIASSIEEVLNTLSLKRKGYDSRLDSLGIANFPELRVSSTAVDPQPSIGGQAYAFKAFNADYQTKPGVTQNEVNDIAELMKTQAGLAQAISLGLITPR